MPTLKTKITKLKNKKINVTMSAEADVLYEFTTREFSMPALINTIVMVYTTNEVEFKLNGLSIENAIETDSK